MIIPGQFGFNCPSGFAGHRLALDTMGKCSNAFFSETTNMIKAKIANNPTLAKALTDPSLTLEQKQQLAKALVSGVMVELGYTQAVNVKLVEKTNDNRAGHYGEDNNIYLNDAKINNTKDLATTIGHETSHAMDDQDQQDPDPDINTSTSASTSTNPQNNASKADNEIYADNYGDDFGDYVEFASENYGDGNLANTNNRNLHLGRCCCLRHNDLLCCRWLFQLVLHLLLVCSLTQS
jgi:hypothetical protein